VINYIGEIGSYLLAQPERPEEREHNVNFAVGNGLSQSVWSEMKIRFGIKRIVEFYASTEGNCNLVNSEGQLGACGFIPGGLAKKFFPVNLIKCNPSKIQSSFLISDMIFERQWSPTATKKAFASLSSRAKPVKSSAKYEMTISHDLRDILMETQVVEKSSKTFSKPETRRLFPVIYSD
jgi:hypothetical protein